MRALLLALLLVPAMGVAEEYAASVAVCNPGTETPSAGACSLFKDERGPYATEAECEGRIQEMVVVIVNSTGLAPPRVKFFSRCGPPPPADGERSA